MEHPLNTPPDESGAEVIKKDRSLLYMGLILGTIIMIMGYLTLFVDDVSSIFSSEDEPIALNADKSQLLNENADMSDEEVRKSLIKFIEAFYYDQRKGYFDPPSYFASITQTYFNYHNLTFERLRDIHNKRLKEYRNLNQNWIVSSLDYKRNGTDLVVTYWNQLSYYRPLVAKQESADVKYEMIINEAGKIYSLREIEVKNLTSFDVQTEADTAWEETGYSGPESENAGTVPTAESPEAVYEGRVYDLGSVESAPEFQGGQKAFTKFLSSNIKYPTSALESNIHGKVYVGFIVEKNGSLSDLKIIKGIGSGCDEEAIRVLKMSPVWKPGMAEGKPVRTAYTFPVSFTIAN